MYKGYSVLKKAVVLVEAASVWDGWLFVFWPQRVPTKALIHK